MQPLSHGHAHTCPGCNTLHLPVTLQPGEAAHCHRCGTRIAVRPRTGPQLGMAWSLTALGMFIAAALVPIMEVSNMGLRIEASILVVVDGFRQSGMPLLGWICALMLVVLPILAILGLILVNAAALRRWQHPHLQLLIRFLEFAREWAMPEVFLLAVMVTFIKIGDMAQSTIDVGLWFLTAGSIALIAAFQRIERDGLASHIGSEEKHHRIERPLALSASLLLAATLLLIPANILPIMEMKMPGQHSNQNILGGVSMLLEHGMLGIAAVVFIASVFVPFGKLIGLTWLHWVAHQRRASRRDMQLYSMLRFIGRWSMLDVFLVAILAGLIQFGQLAEVRPGAATPVFAAAVILTALAVEQFDTRRLWRPIYPSPLKN